MNWRQAAETIKCVKHLQQSGLPTETRIHVVDNGSGDESAEVLKYALSGVNLILSPKNAGFAGGVNVGIHAALRDRTVDAVLLLNNDALMNGVDLPVLIKHLNRDARTGVVGAVVVRDSGSIEYFGGGRVNTVFGVAINCGRPQQQANFISGCCMLIRRAVLEDIGMLDERFFMYWEDADFCLRATKYWKLGVCREVRVVHRGSGSLRDQEVRREELFVKSGVTFFRKHGTIPLLSVCSFLLWRIVMASLRPKSATKLGAIGRALGFGRETIEDAGDHGQRQRSG